MHLKNISRDKSSYFSSKLQIFADFRRNNSIFMESKITIKKVSVARKVCISVISHEFCQFSTKQQRIYGKKSPI